jgi:DUF4097 and DUF4098 domain-containing protein YvlB
MAGPVVLIIVGIVFLLAKTGIFAWHMLFVWFAQYWPVLLIVWGLIKLVEYYHARNAGYVPSGIGVGGVFLLMFLILVGMSASVGQRVNWNALGDEMQMGHGRNFPLFGNDYEYTEQAEHAMAAGDTVRINNSHGDIVVNTGTGDKLRVTVKKHVDAENQSDADKLNQATHPAITADGHTLTVAAAAADSSLHMGPFAGPSLRADLEIELPRKASLEITTQHGDVKIAGRDGDVAITDAHGDISVSDVNGDVKLTMNHGDASVSQIKGNTEISGHASDVSVSDVSGTVSLSGDFFGDTSLAKVGKTVRFTSSRTTMEMGALAGELKMDSGDLTVRSASGGFRIHTRSKDLHLEDVSGDVEVENSNADVELHAGKLPLGNVAINNRRGPIQVYLPEPAAFQLDATSRGGQIHSDFGEIKIESSNDSAKGSGSVGNNGRRLELTAEHGDIDIRKG